MKTTSNPQVGDNIWTEQGTARISAIFPKGASKRSKWIYLGYHSSAKCKWSKQGQMPHRILAHLTTSKETNTAEEWVIPNTYRISYEERDDVKEQAQRESERPTLHMTNTDSESRLAHIIEMLNEIDDEKVIESVEFLLEKLIDQNRG